MQENVRKKRLSKPLRFIKLLNGMREGKGLQAIADECGCSYITVERDFWEWKENGGLETWITTELMLLHDRVVQDDKTVVQAYRGMIELAKKYIVNKVAVQGDVRIDLAWEELGNTSQSNIALTLDNKNSTQAKQDSESSHAADGSAKPLPGQTKASDKPSYAA